MKTKSQLGDRVTCERFHHNDLTLQKSTFSSNKVNYLYLFVEEKELIWLAESNNQIRVKKETQMETSFISVNNKRPYQPILTLLK